jgi:hypothetical protein
VLKYFDGAMEVLQANRELFSTFVENKISLEQAAEVFPSPASLTAVLYSIREGYNRKDRICYGINDVGRAYQSRVIATLLFMQKS